MTDLGKLLDLNIHVKYMFIFTTSGGSCSPWGLIIILLDSRNSLCNFLKHIELKAMSRPIGLGTIVDIDYIVMATTGIHP